MCNRTKYNKICKKCRKQYIGLDNKQHTYIIDFYLPSLNKYIEVKGWWNDFSIKKFNEVKGYIDICIIDNRNINNLSLDLAKLPMKAIGGDI